jgi:MoxR-like ATPase
MERSNETQTNKMTPSQFDSPASVQTGLFSVNYLASEALSTVVYLALAMKRPLFLEGEPGSGKTELAKAIAQLSGAELLRLQCYEGIDASQALYEWDYARQLLHLRLASQTGLGEPVDESALFSERFLLRRPLLKALSASAHEPRPVLLIDEVDRADDEFEAFLLEALSEYAVSVPELGTIRASNPPIVILTSNRTRDVHDALKRRSLYHWLEQPSFEDEVAIVISRAPSVSAELAREVTKAVQVLRDLSLYKPPGVAETIDWATALADLGRENLDLVAVDRTLGLVVKYREDLIRVREAGLETLFIRTSR